MQRQFRLCRAADFAHVRADGRFYQHGWFVLRFSKNELEHNRYGIIVSRRVGGAVQRNRVRRLVRESFRCLHSQMLSGYDFTLTARPTIVGQSFHRICAAIEAICAQANLMVDQREEGPQT